MIVAALAAAALGAVLNPAAGAQASDKWSLNGTFTATSNGEWARTNDILHDERSVRAIWTVSSQCSYPTECTGTVSSDQGWTAPIYQTGGEWYVKHVVPRWIPCPDGSTADGYQVFRFQGNDPGGDSTDPTSDVLVGEDATTGPSGAAGAASRCSSPCRSSWSRWVDQRQPVGSRSVQGRSPPAATTSVWRATLPSAVTNCPVFGSYVAIATDGPAVEPKELGATAAPAGGRRIRRRRGISGRCWAGGQRRIGARAPSGRTPQEGRALQRPVDVVLETDSVIGRDALGDQIRIER